MKPENLPEVRVERTVEYNEGPTYIPPGGRTAGEPPVPVGFDERMFLAAVAGFILGAFIVLMMGR